MWSVWSIDLANWRTIGSTPPTATLISEVPNAGFLNGINVLNPATTRGPRSQGPRAEPFLLLADAANGVMYGIDMDIRKPSLFYSNLSLDNRPETCITGMCGQPCAQVALDWGHQVRGMGRNAGKLADKVACRLESFVSVAHYYDLEGLRNAVAGVDAVICAYNNSPELVVGAQLALLYAAEKAGVKIFHAATWNYDWTRLQLGEHENYDAYIAFKRTVEISSTIRPLYGFTGGIIEYPWYRDRTRNAINVEEGTVSYFGTGTEEHIWITLKDLAAYTICAVSDQQATAGGLYYVESFRATFPDLGRVYGEARGVEIREICVGDTQTAQQLLQQARESTATYDWNKYIGLAYITAFNEGKLGWKESIDSKRWVGRVHQTDWRSWLAQHQDV